MKIILKDEQLVIKHNFISLLFRIILAFLLALFFLFLAFRNLNQINIFFACSAIVVFILFLFLSFKKRLYQVTFDKYTKKVTITERNLFTKNSYDFPLDAIKGINIDMSMENKGLFNVMVYNMSIDLLNEKIIIGSSLLQKRINALADSVNDFLDNPVQQINADHAIYNTEETIKYTASASSRFDKIKNNSLLGKEISQKIHPNSLELNIHTPLSTPILFFIICCFLGLFFSGAYNTPISDIKPFELLFFPLLSIIVIIINALFPSVSKVIIDRGNSKVQIFSKGLKSKKYEEYPLEALKCIDTFTIEDKCHLIMEIHDKKIELGVLKRNETINAIRDFMNMPL